MATSTDSTIQRFAVDTDPESVWKAVEQDSVAVIKGVVPTEIANKFNEETSPYVAENWADAYANGWRFNPHTIFQNGLLAKSHAYRHDILNNPTLEGVCKAAFKETGDYWLASAVLRCTRPEHPAQPWHSDANGWPLLKYHQPGSPPMIVTIIIPTTDFTEANGATRVFLGSHKWPTKEPPAEAQSVLAEMKAGDMLVMNQGAVHSGGLHSKDAPDDRQLIILSVANCQLTQYESAMGLPRSLVESLTPLAQKLVGWRSLYPVGSPFGLNTFRSKPLEETLELKTNQAME